jgi:Ca2+-binding RTX toxin-like protein
MPRRDRSQGTRRGAEGRTGRDRGAADADPLSVAVGDSNAGSRPDIAVANSCSSNVSVLLGARNGDFGGPPNFPAGARPWSVAVGDFNSDSHNVSVPLNSSVACAGREATIVESTSADRLVGTRGPEVIVGSPGNDRIQGGGGTHLVCGGSDNDHVAGGRGHDRLLGQSGNDGLSGGPGRDLLRGGSGHDRLLGEGGNDRLVGGPSRDLLRGESGNDHPSGGVGKDRILARDSRREVVDCGPGRDVAIVDRHDRRRRCETVGRG